MQVALLCINLHLDMGCADELPLLRSKPAAPFIGHMRSRPSALLVRHAADPDSQPVQGPKNTQQEFDGGFFQAVLHVGGEASARHADGVENDIEIYEACGDDGDDGDGGTAAASANLSASHFGDRKDAVCALEFPGRLSPAPSAEALAYPNGAVPSVAMKATASEPMPSAVHISRSGKLLNLMSAPRPSADITATSGSLPSHQDFASPAMSVPEASGSISLAVILEPEPAANRSLSTAVVEPLDGPLLPEMPWRSGVSGVTYHGGDPCDRSIRGEGLSTNAPVQAVSPVHPTFLTRVALRDGVRICTQKGLAGPGQLVGVAATAVAPVTVTADAIVSDGYGTIWTQEYHVTDDGGDSNSEGRYGGTSVMQQLGATHVATTLPSGEDGVAVAVANEDGEQEWEKQLQHAPKIALVASSPLKFRAVPNPFLEGQYVVAEFITAAEEMELLALCDDPILKPAWSSWIGQTYSNATAQKTRWGRGVRTCEDATRDQVLVLQTHRDQRLRRTRS
ncbi:hypothetical protein Vafri_11996 [Volvox africanus]|uniref:Uncharacterized protein n=1 Tax=Volvox africanus TaxID=51714 RepID=A0A8J4B928_9CHLO|nr:hypothetical protein Vafri_11996 [Volvox africanus]